MNKKLLMPALLTALLAVTACSHKKDEQKEAATEEAAYAVPVTEDGLMKMTSTWPESSKSAIRSQQAKYGLPNSITDDMVSWNLPGEFKRSVVFRDEVKHQFPIAHSDVLLQTVDYRVPLDKVSQLSKFDGSLIIDRTKGELSARNDKEEMNILSLNLADKIVRGEMNVEQARREYSKYSEAVAGGGGGDLITSLKFESIGNTADPDVMMQSQQEGQPVIQKTEESKEVQKVIEENN
jgi:hypothetical protein